MSLAGVYVKGKMMVWECEDFQTNQINTQALPGASSEGEELGDAQVAGWWHQMEVLLFYPLWDVTIVCGNTWAHLKRTNKYEPV